MGFHPSTLGSRPRGPAHARWAAQGQSISEYAVLLGLVSVALLGIQTYAQRGVQAVVKVTADEFGDQVNGIKYESGDRETSALASGKSLVRKSAVQTNTDQTVDKQTLTGGGRRTDIQQDQTTTSGVLTEVNSPVFGTKALPPNTSSYAEVIMDVE